MIEERIAPPEEERQAYRGLKAESDDTLGGMVPDGRIHKEYARYIAIATQYFPKLLEEVKRLR